MKSTFDQQTEKEKDQVMSFVQKLTAQFGDRLYAVNLFGSHARGDANPDSDLDFDVIVKSVKVKTRSRIRDLAAESWLETGLYISTRVWSRDHWQHVKDLNTGLYQNIR